ncbi:MAG: hypothetical protein R3B09_18105 [Nannocystaceae bacterium]
MPALLRIALAGGVALGRIDAPAADVSPDAAGEEVEDEVEDEGREAEGREDEGREADAGEDPGADAPAEVEGPEAPEKFRVDKPAPVLDRTTLDHHRRAAIGLLVGAGVADLGAFALRGLNYSLLKNRCAEDPATGELPGDTRCPNLLTLNVVGGLHNLTNVGLYALAIEGGKGLGRQRADRVRAGLAPAHDHARALKITVPLAYFTTVGAVVLGYLVFFDKATSPSPGTKLRAPPTHTPAFDPFLQFSTQAAMTVSAAFIAAAMRSRAYRMRMDELEVSAAIGPTPGGMSLGVAGRF